MSSPAARSASAPHDFNPDHRDQNLGPLMRLLVVIEKAGNKLPHPFWLFMGLALVVMVLSWFLERAGVSAVTPSSSSARVLNTPMCADWCTIIMGCPADTASSTARVGCRRSASALWS